MAAAAPVLQRAAGRAAGWLLALLPAGLAAYFAIAANAVTSGQAVVARYEWVPSAGVSLAFRLDGLSVLFALLITVLGAVVIVYGGGYLAGNAQLGRFYGLTLFFMASMLGLVLAENLFVLYVFWEFTSVSSYLLIGFEHDRPAARKAATQALLVTFLGGLGLLAGFVVLQQIAGTAEFTELAARADAIRAHRSYPWALALILLGAFTKSAQFPFHFWLPNAMEAPTPVSAYLHSATMVKAGVFLLARMNPVMGGTDAWLTAVTLVGGVTMVAGAWLALFKTDLKQILAYSTVSVLGVLTLLIGLGTKLSLEAMAVYLAAHSLYKGSLFLVTGAVQHETGTREVGELGGLAKAMPVTAAAAVLAAVSMAGLPPAFGFMGKELLYESGLEAQGPLIAAAVVFTGALLLAAAALAVWRPFFGATPATPRRPHEAPLSMWLGPAALAGAGLLFGLVPGALAALAGSAAAASRGVETVPLTLHLFHGLTPALGLTAISTAAGLALFAMLPKLAARRIPVGRWGPARLYDWSMDSMNALALEQTRILQSGRLRSYLRTIVVAALALVVAALVRSRSWPRELDFSGIHAHEAMLALAILIAIAAAVRSRSRLAALAALGVVGIGIAVIFALFGAPDVAMTLLAAEILTVILLLLVLNHLPTFSDLGRRAERVRDAVVALSTGALMAVLVLAAPAARRRPGISSFFVDNSYHLAHGRNVVNVILTDFRSLDTLGEITVLAVAGGGVYALLRLRPGREKDK